MLPKNFTLLDTFGLPPKMIVETDLDNPDSEEQQPVPKQKHSRRGYTQLTSQNHEGLPRFALSRFVRMCTLQLGSSMCYAIEITIVMQTLICFQFYLTYSSYVWSIPALFGFLFMPAFRSCFRRISGNACLQRIIILIVCIFQILGMLMLVGSKDFARLVDSDSKWSTILNNQSKVFLICKCTVATGFVVVEFCGSSIRAIYMELMLDRYRMIYDTTAVQCLHLFRGIGMVIGFFIGSQVLDPNKCKFSFPPFVVFLVFYIISSACTLISIKSNPDTLSESSPLEPLSTSSRVFKYDGEFDTKKLTLRQFYVNHFEIIGKALKSTPMFAFVQVLAWGSLMNFLYLFMYMQTNMSKSNMSYLISLTKDAGELRCTYTTTAFGLSIYAVSFTFYCAGIKKLRKYISTVNLYCAALILFALGMTMLATVPSCIEILLIPAFPGILHATLVCVTSLGRDLSGPDEQDKIRVSFNDQVVSESCFFFAQLIWALTAGPVVSFFKTVHSFQWVSVVVSSIAAIIASRLCV